MVVYIGGDCTLCIASIYFLENQRVIEERYNVKPGDMILTDIGTGFLVRETRAYWFYLFKTRMNRIKKTHMWQMIDCGHIDIKYAEGKKYRRIQKRFRTLDLRTESVSNVETAFDEFIKFVNLPCSVVFDRDSSDKIKLIVDKINELSLEFYAEKSYSSNSEPVIRIIS